MIGDGTDAAAGGESDQGLNLGNCLRDMGDAEGAVEFYAARLPQRPSASGHAHYAYALLTAGRVADGRSECEFPWLPAPLLGRPPASRRGWRAWLGRLPAHRGFGSYHSRSVLATRDLPTFLAANTPLWDARYISSQPDFSTLGWDHAQLGIYQYWNLGTVPGFSGAVDLDVRRSVAGSCASAFQKLLIQSVLRVAMMSS